MIWQSVVFDLDDTLYPEKEYVFSGFRAVAAWIENQFGIPTELGFVELCHLFEQGVRGNTFNQWLNKHQLMSERLIGQLISIYREHSPQIRPYFDAVGALQKIGKSSKLGIISDGPLLMQQRKVDALGIKHFFDCIVFSDVWGRENWKPSKRPYVEALLQLQSQPELTVYVGDNPLKDFYGARACGWHSVWLKHENGEYTHLAPPAPSYMPHVIVDSFQELVGYLDKNLRESRI